MKTFFHFFRSADYVPPTMKNPPWKNFLTGAIQPIKKGSTLDPDTKKV
jgi:hypothetical protein